MFRGISLLMKTESIHIASCSIKHDVNAITEL
jgi:hypothetical protein